MWFSGSCRSAVTCQVVKRILHTQKSAKQICLKLGKYWYQLSYLKTSPKKVDRQTNIQSNTLYDHKLAEMEVINEKLEEQTLDVIGI